MIRPFPVTLENLSLLSRGAIDYAFAELLRAAQMSKHLLLIKMIGQQVDQGLWQEAMAVFQSAKGTAAVNLVLGDPWTGAWAAKIMRGVGAGQRPSLKDALYVNALAASVAVEIGIDADLSLPVDQATVCLPRRGTVTLDRSAQSCVVRIRDGELAIHAAGQVIVVPREPTVRLPHWRGLRRLDVDPGRLGHEVILDDLSPYRQSFLLPVTGRLPDTEFRTWQRYWDEAWLLLNAHLPARATELAWLLNTLVPLSRLPGAASSATTRDAFGACAMSRPPDGANMAVVLIHESRHTMLNALLDLVDLYQDSTNTYFAPWREDSRPIGGLLHGTFAFLAIADAWYRLSSDPGLEQMAVRQFAVVKEQVTIALDTLERAPELNDLGRAFVAGMRQTLDLLSEQPHPSHLASEARTAVQRRYARWRATRGGG